MELTSESRIGDIVARYPLATRVFDRYGIDFCCGGGKRLGDVCAEGGLSTVDVLEDIRETLTDGEPTGRRWDEAPLSDLVRHIVERYHEPLREELPRLEAMTRKVVRVHGALDPLRFTELLQVFTKLEKGLEIHLDREELALFPEVLDDGRITGRILASFEEEHAEMGQALARIRELTDGYQAPEDACGTWRALWRGLAALEDSLHRHMHLESYALFNRVQPA